ncbi:hypothetical protein [Flavobacterium arsenatis]|nr:hypothetical protein [Flavobacterium arsenatis]
MERKVIRKFFRVSSRYFDMHRVSISLTMLFVYVLFTILLISGK